MNIPKKFLSYSQIESYLNCPRRYKFVYVDNLKKPFQNENLIIGSHIHEAIAEFLLLKRLKRTIDVEETIKIHEVELRQDLNENSKIMKELGLPPIHASELVSIFRGSIKQWITDIFPDFRPTSIEKKIELEIAGYPFVMYLDAIHDKRRIIDWKVTKRAKSKTETENSLQLALYAYGSKLPPPVDTGYVSLIKPRINSKNWKPAIIKSYYQQPASKINWAVEIVGHVGQAIEAGAFPPCKPDFFLCNEKWCDCWPLCRGKHTSPDPGWIQDIYG